MKTFNIKRAIGLYLNIFVFMRFC